ncbi:MAP kinase kinase (MEK) [Borealophlyctis nickersoniae]|nr:MAP kinase kinase (MEK) [Borealophlyctis nickersoniae]
MSSDSSAGHSPSASPSRRRDKPSRLTLNPKKSRSGSDFDLYSLGLLDSKVTYRAEDLQHIAEIGSGTGGTVSKVLHRPSGMILARKVVTVVLASETERKETEKRILRELKILRKCRSPYIVTFLGAFPSDGGDISMLMEYMDIGSLEKIYKAVGPLPESIVAKITTHVLKGLCYLHEKHNVIHRDIKPSNILVNTNGEVKIADFGVSKELINGTRAITFTGTQAYLAPERLCHGNDSTVEADVWSLGISMMEIALARFPFPPEDHPQLTSVLDLLQFIASEPAPTLPPGQYSLEFEEFTEMCLIKEADARPSPGRLIQTAFCQRAIASGLDLRQWAMAIAPTVNR